MYDHLRAALQATLSVRQQQQAAAQQNVSNAQATITGATQALAAATASLQSSQSAQANAQAAVNAALATQQQRQQAVDQAQSAVSSWLAQEPPLTIGGDSFAAGERTTARAGLRAGDGDPIPRPRPNPEHATWLVTYNQLKAALAGAQSALSAAQSVTAQAQASLGSANAAVSSAQAVVAARTQDVAVANAALRAAQGAVQAAATAVAEVQGQVAALDARAALLVAEPLDRPGIVAAADAEQAEVSRLRGVRAQARQSRFAAVGSRVTLLAAHDQSVAGLPSVATALKGWSDATLPDPATVGVLVDQVVASAAAQRATAPRHDDIAGLVAQLDAAIARLGTSVAAAVADTNAKRAALDAARDDVETVNGEAP
ncbi:hypothetical protein [Cellulomonas alba]|uniref:Uncharacterized protein n=1 Tax=Cellulomonas alba TaxID=3053467 RepID=A0ABT7SCG7_9CELL|nr:hypothetical protein [Cellulomonas alba]MDM7853878.1 hypothetical protein [Cellulomonas alba]